ncbi:MAG: hypothetical protein JJE04_02775 [Acidobacteriia bacterium]|nr:hypothetical protein [Terriglobia bacterium]
MIYRTLEELEKIVRDRICRVCTDRTVEGECGREDPQSCALFRMFPQVALAIQTTNSDDIRDYVEALRKYVCAQCESQTAGGNCEQRRQVRCSLDAYLIAVVDAIEDATGKRFDRKLLPPLEAAVPFPLNIGGA